jgi:peptidoglycan hydrolase-like protein with peptidoglycan-binding domain
MRKASVPVSLALRAVSLLAGLLVLGASPAFAADASTAAPRAAAPAAPVAGQMKLVLQHVGGNPPFALLGQRIVVRGIVTPYVAGQTVKVSFYREGRKVGVKLVRVAALGNGAGQFHVGFVSHDGGLVQARAAHYATAKQRAFRARSPDMRFVSPNVGFGANGQSVRLLQSELSALHYAVPLSGVFEERTGWALIAYRKMTGLARVPDAGTQVFAELARGAGSFHVRYRGDGRHVEADLSKQVLAEIEPGGRVRAIYIVSSGKPSTPTVVGRFRVYLKTPGFNSEGMYDSNYFISGYAIHGYAEVPTYAASHGCLRVPIPEAPEIYAWVRTGTAVDVYDDAGGGSSRVRNDAGP